MITLKPPQWTVFNSDARFRVLVAGRRFGKTFLSLVELCRAAWSQGRLAWYVAPTYKQAKRIAWKPLKQMTRPYWASRPNETDLRIELITGGTICLRGADNYDSLRGDGLDFLILDEYASIAREAWPEVLRPALADKQGRALFIGTPRGYNHFYDLYQSAQEQPAWATFQFTTEEGGNVSAEELEGATHELDERTYRQEFQASFENLTGGLVYYAFDRAKNVRPVRFNPRLPLFWSLDFNINPMCSVIGQRDGDRLYILEELALPDSNTWAACEAFLDRISQWRSSPLPFPRVQVYGDATGNGRQTAASRTDWQIVRDFFNRYPCQLDMRVTSSNPPVKDRVNCVNAMLHNQAGERRLWIDPGCKQLITDFERVHWKTDHSGNMLPDIDKSDPMRSHVSDALGYIIAYEFGMRGKFGEMPEFIR
jgi:Terminase large subunit, T4likevirus-type, N-terminal